MSTSQPYTTASFAPGPTTQASTMAQTMTTAMGAPLPSLDHLQRRTPQPVYLPPLSIPPSARLEQRQTESSRLPRSSALQAAPTYPVVLPPSIAQSARRRSSGPAVPLADILSPQPSTPSRSDSGFSPLYKFRRSPPRSFVDPHPPPRQAPEQFVQEGARGSNLGHERPYISPTEGTYRSQTALIPSPAYTPTYEHGSSHYQSVYAQRAPSRSITFPAHRPETVTTRPPAVAQLRAPENDPDNRQLSYHLRVRQQPIAARACGFGERDRRVIDPPPIIQLVASDPQTGTVDLDELRYSLHIVHCTLWSEDGLSERTALQQPDRRTTRRLMGQLVASPSVAKDEHDVEGCFFCFPDLSCRTHGRYRLRFLLLRLDPANLHVGSFSPVVTEVLSDVFTVYTAKDFPGMRPSSALTRALKLQGCNIQVKKGNEKALARKRRSIDDSNEDKDDEAVQTKRRKDSA